MEMDRPHLRTTNSSSANSEPFICFTSGLSSSSSMKISKSILSPGRARDPPVSLSTSLSRRLRTYGSMKGGQASPMFPTGGKKRGCAFENPEPSSPKVTCIGQVRVKTKKKVNQTRSLSRRRSGEVSFRSVEQARDALNDSGEDFFARTQRFAPANSSSHFQQPECLPHRNQRWVHLPVTICEALRAFGAEFSCLFPCRSSCFSTNEREKGEKFNGAGEQENGQSSCGAVFARWFVSLQDCEGRQGRKIELVVGEDDERTEARERISMRSSRRHVFDDLEINDETIEMKGEGDGEGQEEEKARVSICIPPKNALLLMRCRSDPMKMAALANRFWDSPAPEVADEEEDEGGEEEVDHGENKDVEGIFAQHSEFTNETPLEVAEVDELRDHCVSTQLNNELENQEKEANLATLAQENEVEKPEEPPHISEEEEMMGASLKDKEFGAKLLQFEAHADQEVAEHKEDSTIPDKEEEVRQSNYSFSSENSNEQCSESEMEKLTPESFTLEASLAEENEEQVEKSKTEEEIQDSESPYNEEEQTTTHLELESQDTGFAHKADENDLEETAIRETEDEESKNISHAENADRNIIETKNEKESSTTSSSSSSSNVLPDCLLLMMCEPKLSMEVSKETWVCSTDFIRCLPGKHVKKTNGSDEHKKIVSTDSNPGQAAEENKTQKQKKPQQQLMQPPRSSCTLPAATAVSMATMIEQKLVNAVGYEPFVLTRCKSEPRRTAAAKLVPDACFWNNRKLEPHRPATFGVGAAGVGF